MKLAKRKQLLVNIAVLFATVLVLLVLCEISIRVINPQSDYFYTFDPVTGVVHVPNMEGRALIKGDFDARIKMNSYGFNDREYTIEKPADTIRIVVLGDSFVEALQVPLEETFHEILEEKLNTVLDKNIEVISFGIGGFGTCDEYLVYQRFAEQFDPDIVVLAYLTHNDINENTYYLSNPPHRPRCFINDEGNMEFLPPKQTLKNKLLRPFYRHSHLVRYLFKFTQAQATTNCVEQQFPSMGIYYKNYTTNYEYGLNISDVMLGQFADELKAEGIEFYLVTLTNAEQVNPALWNERLEQCPALASLVDDPLKPDRLLNAIAAKHDIEIVQLVYPFREAYAQNNTQLHLSIDKHWNAEGHELAASVLFDELTERSAQLQD